MSFCTSCGKEINPDSTFCPHCGQRQAGSAGSVGPESQFLGSPAGAVPAAGASSGLLFINDILMKKKILSVREHYDLEDTQGNKVGEGDGNFFQLPAKFIVVDSTGREAVHINGKLVTIRREFDFIDGDGRELGKIKKKIVKLFGSEYWVEQNGVDTIRIYGNFYEHDYRFEINGQEVAQVHKKWVSVRDQFGISISGPVDHRIVIGSVIVIEHDEVSERK